MNPRLALSSLLLVGAVARGDEPPRTYVVQPGDDCARIAERFYGSRRAYGLLHEANPGLGPQPHKLVPGTTLVVPLPRPDAELTRVERIVEKVAPGLEDWERASTGDDLHRGAKVATRRASAAEITFTDRSVVELRADTMVVIYGASAEKVKRGTEARLERGTLRSRLGDLAGGELAVTTPSARATLRGGDALVSVDDQRMSRIANHKGRPAEVRGASGAKAGVRVDAGMGTRVAKGAPPEPPRPLPPAPAWEQAPALVVGIAGSGARLRLAWQEVPGAAAYRVVIRRGDEGTVVDREIPARIRELDLQALPPGEYRVSLATVDLAGLEGPPRDHAFTSARVGVLVPGAQAADLETPLGARFPAGSLIVVPESLRCAATPAADEATVALAPPGPLPLYCATPSGARALPVELTVEPAGLALEDAPGNPVTRLVAGATTRVVLRQRGTPFAGGLRIASLELEVRGVKSVRPGLWQLELVARRPGAATLDVEAVHGERRVPITRLPLTVIAPTAR